MTSFSAEQGPWLIPGIDDRLIVLHGEGQAFREIAEKMSAEFGVTLTKNSIAGRCHRLCLRVKPRAVEPKAKQKAAKREPIVVVIPAPTPPEPEPVQRGVDLLELRLRDCRFPYGDHPFVRYCGKPLFHRSYCKTHFKLSYVMPRERWGG